MLLLYSFGIVMKCCATLARDNFKWFYLMWWKSISGIEFLLEYTNTAFFSKKILKLNVDSGFFSLHEKCTKIHDA